MTTGTLIRRSLTYYARTNFAVVVGVAVAVSVLGGALLVGQSVRTSLRNLVIERLGNTGTVIGAANPFREQVAAAFGDAAPLLRLEGVARHQASGRLASGVQVYGVDNRFWRFQGLDRSGPEGREVYLSEPLARELGAETGDGVLLRIEQQSYTPAESLQGRKDDTGVTVRLTVAAILTRDQLGEFNLEANQGTVKAAFVGLAQLQGELDQAGRVNTILLPVGAADPEDTLTKAVEPTDLGLEVKVLEGRHVIQVDSRAGLLTDSLAATIRSAASQAGLTPSGIYTYLANTIRVGDLEIPYSLVSAVEGVADGNPPAIELNGWAARELNARPGDDVTLDYYLWRPEGRLETASARFRLAAVRPIDRDPSLAPEYPGITDSEEISDWDPPFPIDLSRVRPEDEAYWDDYRTTPKAFIPLATGQRLWQSRWGSLTAYRLAVPEGEEPSATAARFEQALGVTLEPLAQGFTVIPVRELGLTGSQGATDFGEYFVYFSFFLVVSALLLAGMFFRLGLEQRVRQTGLLEAVGLPPARLRVIFGLEGIVLAVAGTVLGVAGAIGYCQLILYGLRTWWIDAVGTQAVTLDADPMWLAVGALGGLAASIAALLWTLRSLRRITPRNRLAGVVSLPPSATSSARTLWGGIACIVVALALLGAAASGVLAQVAGFFGAGFLLLVGALMLFRNRLGRPSGTLAGNGVAAHVRLGFRNAAYQPGRTVLSVTLIASAIFLIVSVDSFRLAETVDSHAPDSPTGGFPLMAEASLPLYRSPAVPENRAELGIEDVPISGIVPFRLRPGDDVSCLNLYRPQNPRILGAPRDFLEDRRFRFQDAVAESENPWELLLAPATDGAIPAAVAANSMTYILHRKLGDVVEIPVEGGEPVRLRLVAALADSVFQREVIISAENFRRAFPHQEGYRVFLIDTPPAEVATVTADLEDIFTDYGFDVVDTGAYLAGFHRVENTYLSTFQALGALGLLLGTVGLAVILLRNVLERGQQLALLRAVGFRPGNLAVMVVAENVYLLVAGILIGTVTALIAIVPALAGRGGAISPSSLALLLAGVFATGLLASILATAAVLRAPLLAALRTE